MSKRHEQSFHRRESKYGQYTYENMLTSLSTREISVETTVKYHFVHMRLGKPKSSIAPSLLRVWRDRHFCALRVGLETEHYYDEEQFVGI